MPVNLTPYNELCFAVYTTNRYFHKLYHLVLHPFGLTYLQYMVLLIVYRQQTTTISQVCSELDMANNTLTPVVQKLVQKNWLLKQRAPEDVRRFNLSFNPAQNAQFNLLQTKIAKIQQLFIHQVAAPPITEMINQQHQLNQQLKELAQQLEKQPL